MIRKFLKALGTLLAAIALAPLMATPGTVLGQSFSVSPIVVAVSSITGLAANVATFLATPSSANLASALTDKTGTGVNVFATSPNFTTGITINSGTPLTTYTEGTWIPVLTVATPGDLSVSYTTQIGSYTRVGRLVTVTGVIVTSAFTYTTASGTIQITGLPVAVKTLTGYQATGAVEYAGYTSASRPQMVVIAASGASLLTFAASGTGVGQALVSTTQILTASSVVLAFTISYEAT